jgi:hypothetical protein
VTVARSLTPARLVFGLVGALSSGCGSDAAGVDDCRKIEYARCDAASHCGDRFAITDVDECKRFYRNQCLHGLASGKSPGTGQVAACVKIIQTAGSCAAQHDPKTALAACGDPTLAAETDPSLLDVCTVVAKPELTAECWFLSGVPPVGLDAGSVGAAGAGAGNLGGGGTGGTGGEGGTAGA